MTTVKLLPCPFCGSKAQFGVVPYMHRFAGEDTRNINQNHGAEYIECTNNDCAASSMLVFPTMADAKPLLIEKWNRRSCFTCSTQEPACACGNSSTLGIVHRTDGPCFVYQNISKPLGQNVR